MPEWDERNRPKDYIITVTPGFSKFGDAEEQLRTMGLARKLIKAARLGFEFAEIDFEALSEMFEPEIAKQVDQVKKTQNLDVGLHLPVSMDLCLASSYMWKQMHTQLRYGSIAGAEKLKAKFILFHTSSQSRPPIAARIGERSYPSKMSAWNGQNLGNFIEEESKKNGNRFDLKDWFMARHIKVLFSAMGVAGDPGVISFFADEMALNGIGFKEGSAKARAEYEEIRDKVAKPIYERIDLYENNYKQKAQLNKARHAEMSRELSELYDQVNRMKQLGQSVSELEKKIDKMRLEYDSLIPEAKELEKAAAQLSNPDNVRRQIRDALEKDSSYERYTQLEGVVSYIERTNFKTVYEFWKNQGSECDEAVAYHVMAKWMFKRGDKLYKNIVKADKRDPDILIQDANVKAKVGQKTMTALEEVITAVAAKYTEGHLNANYEEFGIHVDSKNNMVDPKKAVEIISPLEYCRRHKVHIFIETNMPGQQEGGGGGGAPPGELRIIRATHHVEIVKAIDPENLSYCIDFEHLLTNYIDPEKEAEELKKNQDGKYIRCWHTNAPRPISGAHGPVLPISNDMYIIYRYMKKLRDAGSKDAYIIWEMGSHGVRESAIAFRRLVDALHKDLDPEKLPPEFFGIDDTFRAFQNTAVREHAYDPLQGLFIIPEESHTFLSKSAVDKGKGAEWGKEKFR